MCRRVTAPPAAPKAQRLDDASGSEYLDGARHAWRRGEPLVGGQQRAAEALGQGHVDGVIRRHVVAEFERSAHERQGWEPGEIQVLEVVDRGGEPTLGQVPGDPALAEHGNGLEVEQVRCGEIVAGRETRARDATVSFVVGQCVRQDA